MRNIARRNKLVEGSEVFSVRPRHRGLQRIGGNQPASKADKGFSAARAVVQPGNYRNRRLFNNRTGLAAGRNEKPILLQTYRLDMGGGKFVWLKDLSTPIFVEARHWAGCAWTTSSTENHGSLEAGLGIAVRNV